MNSINYGLMMKWHVCALTRFLRCLFGLRRVVQASNVFSQLCLGSLIGTQQSASQLVRHLGASGFTGTCTQSYLSKLFLLLSEEDEVKLHPPHVYLLMYTCVTYIFITLISIFYFKH